ncbi:MAG: hypothetical protein K2Z81_02540 [Cyanobacteria bacterium]|nr:hypothetical protein [Cyanobacteriota bacterium]
MTTATLKPDEGRQDTAVVLELYFGYTPQNSLASLNGTGLTPYEHLKKVRLAVSKSGNNRYRFTHHQKRLDEWSGEERS